MLSDLCCKWTWAQAMSCIRRSSAGPPHVYSYKGSGVAEPHAVWAVVVSHGTTGDNSTNDAEAGRAMVKVILTMPSWTISLLRHDIVKQMGATAVPGVHTGKSSEHT